MYEQPKDKHLYLENKRKNMSDYLDPWRYIESQIEEEMRRQNEKLFQTIEDSSTYWDSSSWDGSSEYYHSIWHAQISMIMVRYIYLLIRKESQKEREWLENLKKNLQRFLP